MAKTSPKAHQFQYSMACTLSIPHFCCLIPNSDKGLGKLHRVEGLQIVHALPHAGVLYRHPQFPGDGYGDSPLGSAVQLGEHDTSDTRCLLELLSLDKAVLPRGGVQYQ